MMKDELGGKIVIDFFPLRGKMYAYRNTDRLPAQQEHKESEDKHCKGSKKCRVAEGFTSDGYKTCLFDGKTIYWEQMLFENKKHTVYMANKHKIALNSDDDK